ncbi:MAG: 2-phospho-L-lactate guanylyltransferase [Chloroflexi bacterium]|nr:2-phospho-L-lactate guanylyltransferase [Chloroflexota bacterium]MCY4246975.1 2-phospho-L-lactate guanylyltransferase [Chloroflexota bacterium]
MSLWAIIPVKPLKNAKSRLAAALLPEERYQLAQAMFRHVLSVALQSPSVTGALVISRDTKALAIGRELGAKTLQESAESNLNPALLRATVVLQAWRADAVLVLPADLPFINDADIAQLVSLSRDRSIVIATDSEQDGTNALLLRPPGAIAYAFGAGSYARHIEDAARGGIAVHRYESPRTRLDIDVPADLRMYRRIIAEGGHSHLPALAPLQDKN